MATRKMQSPIGSVLVPQILPPAVENLIDPDKFNPFTGINPVLINETDLPPRRAAADVGNPWAEQSVNPNAPTGVPMPQFKRERYQPQANARFQQGLQRFNETQVPFEDYSGVVSPQWTFNDAPPTLGTANQKQTTPVGMDIALAMMGLGGLMGNSDYAIQAGSKFLGNATEGARKADQADYQSQAASYDDRLRAAGIRYQRDADMAQQQMRSVDATNAIRQRQNDSQLDNLTRQYQIDTANDKAEQDRESEEKIRTMQAMTQFVNSGRLATATAGEMAQFRDFLQGGEADPMMQFFYAGVSPDKQAQLNWAKADSATRAEIARQNREAMLTGIDKRTAAARDIARSKDISDNIRQGTINSSRKEVAQIMAAAKKAGASNPNLERALQLAQAQQAQAHSEIGRAQTALSKAAGQMNTLRARKDFIDNDSPDGLTPAGRAALQQAQGEYARAEEMLRNADNAYSTASQFYGQTYNAYAQIMQSNGVTLPALPQAQGSGAQRFDEAGAGAVANMLSIFGGGLPEQPAPPANPKATAPATGKPSAANGWQGLTADQYRKMSPAQKKTVPEAVIWSFMSGGR